MFITESVVLRLHNSVRLVSTPERLAKLVATDVTQEKLAPTRHRGPMPRLLTSKDPKLFQLDSLQRNRPHETETRNATALSRTTRRLLSRTATTCSDLSFTPCPICTRNCFHAHSRLFHPTTT